MKFLNKLERKFGRYAIPNLTRYIILTYIIGYILYFISSYTSFDILSWLTLNPYLILKGQVWRLVTWILTPPGNLDIFAIIMLICYYQLGTILERTWGDFLYNVYIFLGLIMTVIGSFILYAFYDVRIIFQLAGLGGISLISTYYVSLSIFLGFAMTFPDQQMLFMFIIPLKIKYLALVDVAYLIYCMIRGGLISVVIILSSLAGTLIFFLATRNYKKFHPKERQRQRQFAKAMGYGRARGYGQSHGQGGSGRIARHKCAICGQTELDNPDLEFRFCSKCNGNYEYCQNHLFTHEHVK